MLAKFALVTTIISLAAHANADTHNGEMFVNYGLYSPLTPMMPLSPSITILPTKKLTKRKIPNLSLHFDKNLFPRPELEMSNSSFKVKSRIKGGGLTSRFQSHAVPELTWEVKLKRSGYSLKLRYVF